jgi:hypothetical protein
MGEVTYWTRTWGICGSCADLTTKNGMFTLRYEYGSDLLNGQYNTVGGFVNVGFQLENLLNGESPFTMPDPVFRSPRNLQRMLGLKVKRNWHQPEAVVLVRSTCPGPGIVAITKVLEPEGRYLPSARVPNFAQIAAPATVRVCWCEADRSAAGQEFSIQADVNAVAYKFDITAGSGCAVAHRITVGGAGAPQRFVWGAQPANRIIHFGDPGGIAVQFP